jgi:hypothetical protein
LPKNPFGLRIGWQVEITNDDIDDISSVEENIGHSCISGSRRSSGRQLRMDEALVGVVQDAVGLAPTAPTQMKPQPEPSTQEVLAGLVERVTFHNDENGFCVLRAKARGHRDLVTVIGHAAIISAGEWITASGSMLRL